MYVWRDCKDYNRTLKMTVYSSYIQVSILVVPLDYWQNIKLKVRLSLLHLYDAIFNTEGTYLLFFVEVLFLYILRRPFY